MVPSKIPAENYVGSGVNMLVVKVNEVIDTLYEKEQEITWLRQKVSDLDKRVK